MWLKRDWTNSCRDERESFSDECESSNRINANSFEKKRAFRCLGYLLVRKILLLYTICYVHLIRATNYACELRDSCSLSYSLFFSLSLWCSSSSHKTTNSSFSSKVHHFQLPKGASLDLKWSPPKDRTDDPAMESPTPLESVQRTRSLNI